MIFWSQNFVVFKAPVRKIMRASAKKIESPFAAKLKVPKLPTCDFNRQR